MCASVHHTALPWTAGGSADEEADETGDRGAVDAMPEDATVNTVKPMIAVLIVSPTSIMLRVPLPALRRWLMNALF